MIDIETLVRAELERKVPMPPVAPDWRDVLDRSGERARRRRLVLAAAVVAVLGALTATALGGRILHGLGDFSDWIRGTPGTPASLAEQARFTRLDTLYYGRFPERPRIRRLLSVTVGGARYTLYGYRARRAVCLELLGARIEREEPLLGCVLRSDLQRTRDAAVPLVGNGVVSKDGALVAFGFAARGVERLALVSKDGVRQAKPGNGAFLDVSDHRGKDPVLTAYAEDDRHRRHTVPIWRQDASQAGRLRGPSRVERRLTHGTIGWFERHEHPGRPATPEETARLGSVPAIESPHLIRPNPNDILEMIVGYHLGFPRELCRFASDRTGGGGVCLPPRQVFEKGALYLEYGTGSFANGGQFVFVDGLVADGVRRLRIFLSNGDVLPVPLRDNVMIVRVQAAKLPGRVVAYDRAGRVVGIFDVQLRSTVFPHPVAETDRVVIRVPGALLRAWDSSDGGSCLDVEIGGGGGPAGCAPRRFRGRPVQVEVTRAGASSFLIGVVRGDVGALELRFAAGGVATTKPVEGFVLYAVPHGRRIARVVGRDDRDRVLDRVSPQEAQAP